MNESQCAVVSGLDLQSSSIFKCLNLDQEICIRIKALPDDQEFFQKINEYYRREVDHVQTLETIL